MKRSIMLRPVSIIAGFVFTTFFLFADPCPDQQALMKNLRVRINSKIVSNKDQIAKWLPYLDSLKNCPLVEDSVWASLYRRIGSLYKDDQDYINALKYYPRFLDITRANLGKPNLTALDMQNGYYWLSFIYSGLSMKKEKMMALDSCIEYAEKSKINNRANLYALYQKVEYYFDLGDYYRSIDYATRCETIARQCQYSLDPIIQADGFQYNSSSTSWKINALLQLGNLSAAEEYVNQKIGESEKDKTKFNLGTLVAQSSEVQLYKGDYTRAIVLLKNAFQIEQRAGHDFSCKQILNTLGKDVYYDYYHDNQNALKYYNKALLFQNNNKILELSDQIESLNIYTNIAEIFVGEKKFDTAFFYFQKAFEQIIPGASEEQMLSAPRPELLQQKKVYYITSLMIAKGDAFQKKYLFTGNKQFLNDALHVFRVTDQFLELLRKEQTELESKLFWRKDTRRLYERAIDACYALNDEGQAFYFFEKSRAALLNDQLTHQRWVNDKDIRKEIQLTKNIVQLQRNINTAAQAPGKYDELVREKLKQVGELDKVREQIKADNPLYFHSLMDTGFMTIAEARNFILPGHTALLETFTGDSAVYLLFLTRDGNKLIKLDRKIYEKLATEFTSLLIDPGALNMKFDHFRNTAGDLYTMIFQDVNIPAGRIIISPDGPNIPYEALIISKNNKPIKYFVQDYAVSYTYSAQFLESVSGTSTKSSTMDFIGLAPILFNSSFQLVPLTGSDQSLERIDKLFRKTEMVTGKAVTPKRFMDDFYQYQIVQLYTHAADSGQFREPVIYFGDSTLNLSDLVYEERPLTRLMVLSACETASGKFYQGEGTFSFSRGFAALGIPSSISNLWSVENESTYRLTELFYKYLAEGLPLDVALQKAKLEFLKTASHEKQLPYFWAAQILSGMSDPVSVSKPIPVPYLLTGIIAILFVIGLAIKWLVKKKTNQVPGKAETLS